MGHVLSLVVPLRSNLPVHSDKQLYPAIPLSTDKIVPGKDYAL